MTPDQVRAARLARHGLTSPAADEAAYVELFRRLQPVAPEARSYPGSPPRLLHRTGGDDAALADALRAERRLVKGRFHGGAIGYVLREDLPRYAAAHRRPLARLDARQETVLRALTYAGPLSPRQLRHETGLPHRPLMAAVHRLERAFQVCEDQVDDAWDRPLHLTEREHPGLLETLPPRDEAVAEVLAALLEAQVFATAEQLASGSGLGKREVGAAMRRLVGAGRVHAADMDGLGEGWLAGTSPSAPPPAPADVGALVLHTRDPFVRPHLEALARRFAGREILQFLLVGDDLAGAVCGHWRIQAHDVDDVVVDDDRVARRRRDEILAAVRRRYPPPEREVLAFNGEPLAGS